MPWSSPSMNVAVRTWSSTTRKAFVTSSLSPYFLPVSSSIFAMAFSNISVSYTLSTPLSMHSVRSRPMPVSTLRCLSGS